MPRDYKKFLNQTRLLTKSDSLNEYGLDNSAVSITAISNQADKELYVGFSYQFVAIEGNELKFEVTFPEASKVSKGSEKDTLLVTIEKPEMFVGNETH